MGNHSVDSPKIEVKDPQELKSEAFSMQGFNIIRYIKGNWVKILGFLTVIGDFIVTQRPGLASMIGASLALVEEMGKYFVKQK